MLFRQLFESTHTALSYVIGDPITRQAALIDGLHGQLSTYLAALKALGLRLEYVLETHVHEDHASVAPALKALTGARLAVHERGAVHCADLQLRDGDMLYLGEELIEVLYTPGHSACSVTYRWRDRLFTGDTLLTGAVGPCTGRGADPAQLYASVHERLYAQPGEWLVYPGHALQGHRVSSIEQERYTNQALADSVSRAEFLACYHTAGGFPHAPGLPYLEMNRTCERRFSPSEGTSPTGSANPHWRR
jgi:sulfur dioxygenase